MPCKAGLLPGKRDGLCSCRFLYHQYPKLGEVAKKYVLPTIGKAAVPAALQASQPTHLVALSC